MALSDLFKKKDIEEDSVYNGWEDDGEDQGNGTDDSWYYGDTTDGPVAPETPITPVAATPTVALKIVAPKAYEDAEEITEFLMNGNTVLINVDGVDRALAMRIIDYLKGAVKVLDGMITKANRTMLVVTPKNVDISSIEEMIGKTE